MYTNVDLTRKDTTAQFPLGAKYSNGGKAYRYVKYSVGSNNVASVAGYLAYMCYSGTTTVPDWTVSCDYNSSTTIVTTYNWGVGFMMAVLTDGTFGWIQTAGYGDNALLTTGNVAAGETLIASAANGTVDGVAAGALADRALGFALADDSSTAQAAGSYVITLDSPDS